MRFGGSALVEKNVRTWLWNAVKSWNVHIFAPRVWKSRRVGFKTETHRRVRTARSTLAQQCTKDSRNSTLNKLESPSVTYILQCALSGNWQRLVKRSWKAISPALPANSSSKFQGIIRYWVVCIQDAPVPDPEIETQREQLRIIIQLKIQQAQNCN